MKTESADLSFERQDARHEGPYCRRNVMNPIRGEWSVPLLLLGASWGCAIAPVALPQPSPPSAPFFQATSEDATQLATLAAALDTAAVECASAEMCADEVHFSRALMSLFENREAARASFEQVIALHPSSPLAGPSALWLHLLRHEELSSSSSDPQRHILTELSAHWARDWIGRRLDVSVRAGKKGAPATPVSTQAFHKQLQERDRRIAELRFQLDALKAIDHDQENRRRMRTPNRDPH